MWRSPSRLRILVSASIAAGFISACSPLTPTGGPSASLSASNAASPAPLATRLLIDTDMAADDIVAIASLLREPTVEVVGIAVDGTGEAHCPGGLYVARALVSALAAGPIPVACGREAALGPAQAFPDDWRAGADAGYGIALPQPAAPPDGRSADQLILDLAGSGDRPLTILTLGPLTNLAMAVRTDHELPGRVERVVSMAGAIDVPGNVNPSDGGAEAPTAEWNLHADPTAAAEVLTAGFDVLMVPLDATNDVPLDAAFVAALEKDHVAAPADVVVELYARNSFLVTGEPMLWDSLTAMALLHPDLVTIEPKTIRVIEGDGLDGGRTVSDPAGSAVRAAVAADSSRFRERLFEALRRGEPRPTPFHESAVVRVAFGPGTCDAEVDPAPATAGVLRLEATLAATAPAETSLGVALFGLGDLTWEQVEGFAVSPDFASPPPLVEIAFAAPAPGAVATSFGDGPPGSIGVACLSGSFEAPTIQLAGPFELLPP